MSCLTRSADDSMWQDAIQCIPAVVVAGAEASVLRSDIDGDLDKRRTTDCTRFQERRKNKSEEEDKNEKEQDRAENGL